MKNLKISFKWLFRQDLPIIFAYSLKCFSLKLQKQGCSRLLKFLCPGILFYKNLRYQLKKYLFQFNKIQFFSGRGRHREGHSTFSPRNKIVSGSSRYVDIGDGFRVGNVPVGFTLSKRKHAQQVLIYFYQKTLLKEKF